MQLSQTMLLASILSFLWVVSDATPLISQRSPKSFISFPVKRHHDEPKDLHPRIAVGQLTNRALQRLARMSGNPPIPREILERNLMRLVLEVEGRAGLEKRFNRRSLDGGPTDRSLADIDEDFTITKAKPPTGNNSLGLDIEGPDVSYLATIQIGTPPRNFSILMDSGSADFWVGSENCTSTGGKACGNHTFLGSRSSKSFVDTGVSWSIEYLTGSVSGTVVKDNVSIAGLDLPALSFGIASNESSEFVPVQFDGVMGLARSKLSIQKNPISVEVLANAGLIDAPIVSYKLGRSGDKENDGEITFGGLDPSKFDPSTVVTLRSVNDTFWVADLDDVRVDGQSLSLRRNATFDTGSILSFIPVADAEILHDGIPGSKLLSGGGIFSFYSIPCNTKTVVSLNFGGRYFDIDPRDLSLSNNSECISTFVPYNETDWHIGDVFLKNVYFSTDFRNSSISLAKLRNSENVTGT